MARKRKALGDAFDPLATATGQDADEPPEQAAPEIRKSDTTVTKGGQLRRTLYFSEADWSAVLAAADREGRSAAEVVRRAVRRYLGQ